LSGRRDGVSILARVQEYREPARPGQLGSGQRQRKDRLTLIRCAPGPNHWLSPEFNSRELADALLKIYVHRQPLPTAAAHTATS
jgi:hypothetical protein